ncbi:MAG: phosphoglucomutase (alpha-D-glucose-1,6-bisphosphate-dependent) [Bacteroidota bacterium]|nr:phosphoglucomutase (alpha-D-glucose-1,6-bisphosphate-dependent) [Bacteroidota bacterium]
MLVNIPRLITAYFSGQPDVTIPSQKVAFGTSGHRGSSLTNSFNEWHILAITQAICLYRKQQKIEGPLFLGIDTHALSEPAAVSTLEVLAANEVEVMIAENNEYTPTPAVSHAILTYNKGRKTGLADGIVITPSHNPPDDGGFKYNPTNGGPAGTEITSWVEKKANELLQNKLKGIIRIPYEKALRASTTHHFDYINHYVEDLKNVINLDIIRDSGIRIGADPLGGAGVHYWAPIADRYKLNLEVVNTIVDPTFRFMSVDWDGKIRMDPSSSYAMQPLIALKDRYDISVACDTDHDRHGIVTKSVGLVPPNHYLATCIFYQLQHRPLWKKDIAIGKTLVSSRMIDRVTKKLNHPLYEVPVGFKWFVDGLMDGSLGFVGEESAGASFCRLNAEVWTTDKDGFIPALLAAEMTATLGRDPGEIYKSLEDELGQSTYDRVEAPASPEQKSKLSKLNPDQITQKTMAGEQITGVLTKAPGNGASIGGLKLETENGWIAARPSGTENIYKIYAESFRGRDHLNQMLKEAQTIVDAALK